MASYTTAVYHCRRFKLLQVDGERAKLARHGRRIWVDRTEIEVEEPDSPPAARRYEGFEPTRHPAQQ